MSAQRRPRAARAARTARAARAGESGGRRERSGDREDRRARAIRRRLLAWFDGQRRDLPWRRDRDAYRVWVSEVMLQQTRVEVVRPAYERFLAALPDLRALARASEDRVLSLWSGLGYYRRARSLHRAARALVAAGQAEFPREIARARELPGVGAYTAAAVLSISYDEPLAAVDGNAVRVLSRLQRLGRPDGRGEPHASLAARLLDRRRPGDWNQAVMELGQVACLPRAPRCDLCPVRPLCRAARDGVAADHPPPKPRRASERHALRLAVLRDRSGRVALERGAFAHLPGMWLPLLAPPGGEAKAPDGAGLRSAGSFRHAILHRSFDVEVVAGERATAALARLCCARGGGRSERRVFTPRELAAIGRSSLLTKAMNLAEAPRRGRGSRVQDAPHRGIAVRPARDRRRLLAEPSAARGVGAAAPGGGLSDRRRR